MACGGLWCALVSLCSLWPAVLLLACCVALVLCPGMVALSLGAVHAPKIDFKADSKGLLSQGNSRVAGGMKNLLKARFQDVSAHFANTAKKTPGVSWCLFGGAR